jgi:hypothetical protein
MTKEQRQAYSEKSVRRQKLFERKYLKQVFNALHSPMLSTARIVRESGVDEAKRSLDRLVVNEDIMPIIMRLYVDAGVYQANKVLREINASAKDRTEQKGFGFNEEWINAITQFLRLNLLRLVSGITETTKKQIIDILDEGQRKGWGIDKIVNELESPELTLGRARLIVRTELVKAYNKGHELGKDKSKWETEDIWISAKDNRTRHSHREVDGDVIGTGGKFKVPVYKKVGKVDMQIGWDLMTGPGDPNAHIENLANCRCTKVTRARRDENGRLIPKVQRLMIQ